MLEILVKTDMGVGAATAIGDELREKFCGRIVGSDEILALVKQKLKDLLRQPASPIGFAATGPTVIMVCGVNGAARRRRSPSWPTCSSRQGRRSCSAPPIRSAPPRSSS